MIKQIHLFFKDNNLYIRSGTYDIDTLPEEVLIYEGDLPEWKEPNKLIYINNELKILTPLEFNKHRVIVGDLILRDIQKLDDNGNIVLKTHKERIFEVSREEAYEFLKNKISEQIKLKITSGFVYNILGYPCIYDTSSNDQSNLQSLFLINSGGYVRCLNVKTKQKDNIFHTVEQIKKLYYELTTDINKTLQQGSKLKLKLKNMFDENISIENILLEFPL